MAHTRFYRFLILLSIAVHLFLPFLFSQQSYFVDGYHGGIYGHIPEWQTKFMLEKLKEFPDWRINLELEPESWDTIKLRDRISYEQFQKVFADQSVNGQIEYVNPSYGQSYLYNISGESVIRQFTYGMQKLKQHFPSAKFTTYSSEEPCFTSALPQVLVSLGFQYASLKNPNTCWGGYTRAFGGEFIKWVGPDGSEILTVPRYAIESLSKTSTWQTDAWDNSNTYVRNAFAAGIRNPVGMTLQDAGWKWGPWINAVKNPYKPFRYTTWRSYFASVNKPAAIPSWKFTQNDVLTSLVWGSQVLQRIAQQVRNAENKLQQAEKMAALAYLYHGYLYPQSSIDLGWKSLLLAQHHDCWIVPYNGKKGDTWADKVVNWTGNTITRSNLIIKESITAFKKQPLNTQDRNIRVFNTSGSRRKEWVTVSIPGNWGEQTLVDKDGHVVRTQTIKSNGNEFNQLLFEADVAAAGFSIFRLTNDKPATFADPAKVAIQQGGLVVAETDIYKIILDPTKGGTIKNLIAKKMGEKDFVDSTNERRFNEFRGYFYNDGGFKSSADNPATITILENGPARIKILVEGKISSTPFRETISLTQGQRRIDIGLIIDWKENIGIGKFNDSANTRQPVKAFYDDRYKLLALFPVSFKAEKLYKNAPFDVTESVDKNSFFTRWDSIKNNVLLNWADISDVHHKYGLALLSDHCTNYIKGEEHPFGFTLQYSGNGLFSRNYTIEGPSEINYAIVPHEGKWDNSGIWQESAKWNEPLAALTDSGVGKKSQSFVDVTNTGYELSSLTCEGKNILMRIFNAAGNNQANRIYLPAVKSSTVKLVELDGRVIRNMIIQKDKNGNSFLNISMPRFGIRNLLFSDVRLIE